MIISVLMLSEKIYFSSILLRFSFGSENFITSRASEVVRAPSLVEGSEDVSLYDPVTVVAEFPEQLVIVVGAVGQARPLVVPVAEEGLLALGAGEVLHVPVLAHGGDHPLLYRPPDSRHRALSQSD